MPIEVSTEESLMHTSPMTGFLTMYGRKVDPAIPDGNCLFRVLSKQMNGDPSKHKELRHILVSFISQNSHLFGSAWTIDNCTTEEHVKKMSTLGQYGSHAEIKAAASLMQKPVYVATDSLVVGKCVWTVFTPFSKDKLKAGSASTDFCLHDRNWFEMAYINRNHYDGILPIRLDTPLVPPPLKKDNNTIIL